MNEFLGKRLKKNTKKYINTPKKNKNEISTNNAIIKNSFIKTIKIENQESDRILKLQQDFKAGKIKEEDISEEDFNLLSKLYEMQIEKTKQSIENYRNKVISIKSTII